VESGPLREGPGDEAIEVQRRTDHWGGGMPFRAELLAVNLVFDNNSVPREVAFTRLEMVQLMRELIDGMPQRNGANVKLGAG